MTRVLLPPRPLRPLVWASASRKDYRAFPERVQKGFGFELHLAQSGEHPPSAKPLKGIGRGTLELIGDFDGDTFRAVYTVKFREAIYVLHAFKKKSKRGIATPKADVDLIRHRLKAAERDYQERFPSGGRP
jgi:phage-related protein